MATTKNHHQQQQQQLSVSKVDSRAISFVAPGELTNSIAVSTVSIVTHVELVMVLQS